MVVIDKVMAGFLETEMAPGKTKISADNRRMKPQIRRPVPTLT